MSLLSYLLLICACLLWPCKAQAQDFSCFGARQTDGSTLLNLPKFNYSGCEVKLMDKDRVTLAVELIGLENVSLSNKSFTIKDCNETVSFSIVCFTRNIHVEENCTSSCVGNEGLQQPEGSSRHHWWILPPVVVMLLLLTVGGWRLQRSRRLPSTGDRVACMETQRG